MVAEQLLIRVQAIQSSAEQIRREMQRAEAEVEARRKVVSRLEEEEEKILTSLEVRRGAADLLSAVISERSAARDTAARMADRMVTEVFGDRVSFRLAEVVDQAGNIKGIRPVIDVSGVEHDPMRTGGGMMNTVSFALRMAVLLCIGGRRIVLLDEPNVNLDPEKWAGWKRFVQILMQDAGLQVFLISHSGAVIGDQEMVTGGHGKVIS